MNWLLPSMLSVLRMDETSIEVAVMIRYSKWMAKKKGGFRKPTSSLTAMGSDFLAQ